MGWKEIRDGVLLLEGSPNTPVIIDNGAAYVIDPGYGEGRAKGIHRKLESLGVEGIAVITHAHVDHVAECKGFKRVFAHRWEIGLSENPTIRNVLEFGVNTTKGFHFITGDSVRITDEIRWGDHVGPLMAVGTPGHTPGHTTYVFSNVASVGDALFGDRLIDRVKILFHTDVFQARESLNTIKSLAEKGATIIPGHGPVVEGEDAIKLVEENIMAINRMVDDVRDALDEGGTLEEITVRIMERYGLRTEPEFVLLDKTPIRSILSHLLERGEVKVRTERRGIVWEKRLRGG